MYREEGDRLWRAVLAYTGDPDVASESVSEAFAQALGRGDQIATPRSWVWTAAFKIAGGLLVKRERPLVPMEPESLPEPVVDLVQALAQLPQQQRLCVVMHDYADRPVAEIASLLRIARPTVYAHLRQGRDRLRSLLEVHDA